MCLDARRRRRQTEVKSPHISGRRSKVTSAAEHIHHLSPSSAKSLSLGVQRAFRVGRRRSRVIVSAFRNVEDDTAVASRGSICLWMTRRRSGWAHPQNQSQTADSAPVVATREVTLSARKVVPCIIDPRWKTGSKHIVKLVTGITGKPKATKTFICFAHNVIMPRLILLTEQQKPLQNLCCINTELIDLQRKIGSKHRHTGNWYYCAHSIAKPNAASALRFSWAATSSNFVL